jgi:hypothetical protein
VRTVDSEQTYLSEVTCYNKEQRNRVVNGREYNNDIGDREKKIRITDRRKIVGTILLNQ